MRTHYSQRTHLMISQFVVGVTLVRTQHTSHARMASVSTMRMSFDTMCQARGDIPS